MFLVLVLAKLLYYVTYGVCLYNKGNLLNNAYVTYGVCMYNKGNLLKNAYLTDNLFFFFLAKQRIYYSLPNDVQRLKEPETENVKGPKGIKPKIRRMVRYQPEHESKTKKKNLQLHPLSLQRTS